MRTVISVDGFNLFYGCLKGTPFKWLDCYDCGVIVSNDSDMAEAMRLVRAHHPGKVLGVITPGHHRTSQQLKRHAHFVRTIRPGALGNALLPDKIPGTGLHKPADWS